MAGHTEEPTWDYRPSEGRCDCDEPEGQAHKRHADCPNWYYLVLPEVVGLCPVNMGDQEPAMSDETAKMASGALKACRDIPTDKLTDGLVGELRDVLQAWRSHRAAVFHAQMTDQMDTISLAHMDPVIEQADALLAKLESEAA